MASPMIRDEFDELDFSETTFKFEIPAELSGFFDHVTMYQHYHLRSIELVLFNESPSKQLPQNYEAWSNTCYHLASRLTSPASVKFELGKRVDYFTGSGGWSTGYFSGYSNVPDEDQSPSTVFQKLMGENKLLNYGAFIQRYWFDALLA